MENSSQHLPQGQEEFIKTDDALFPMRRNTGDWRIMKPLFIGFLTGQLHALASYGSGLLQAHLAESSGIPSLKRRSLPDLKRLLKINLLFGATFRTASLGVFEILREKLRTNNNGRPLSLCEEACCGLTSGATAVLVWYPVYSAYVRTAPHGLSYGSVFSTLCHLVRDKGVFALWKGSGLYVSQHIAATVGMLASYNPSKKYLMESEDLPERDARICAGIISGFCAAACSHPGVYVKAIKNIVQDSYRLGDRHSYRKIPLYVSQILTPYNGFNFYSGFLRTFGLWAPYCVAQWIIFEHIRMLDKFMEPYTGDSQVSN